MAIKIEDLENLTKLTNEEASQVNGGSLYYQTGGPANPALLGVIASGAVGYAVGSSIYDAYGEDILNIFESIFPF
jgi:hypothetical protein